MTKIRKTRIITNDDITDSPKWRTEMRIDDAALLQKEDKKPVYQARAEHNVKNRAQNKCNQCHPQGRFTSRIVYVIVCPASLLKSTSNAVFVSLGMDFSICLCPRFFYPFLKSFLIGIVISGNVVKPPVGGLAKTKLREDHVSKIRWHRDI